VSVPLDCHLGWVPILGAYWAFSTRCREAYDLQEAKDAGYYRDPALPAAPVVPRGGYQGAVIDPYAVDDVLARTKVKQNEQNDRTFQNLEIPQTDQADGVLLWLAAGVVTIGIFKLIRS
jgi:hypothetical protein